MYEDRGRQYGGEVRKSNKIYVSNLSFSTTEDDLRQVFAKFGPIASVTLKQKETVTFAFLQFSSNAQAESAVQQYVLSSGVETKMNGKTVIGTEIKVQFARGEKRSFGDRGSYGDRGGRFGDRGRGGYQSRNDDDRPRGPRACFNCGQEGHMIRDCPEPRKPRQFNNQGGGGYERRGYENRGDDRSGGNRYNSDRRESRNDDDRRGSYRRDDRDSRRDERRDRSRSRSGDRRRRSPSSGSK